MFHIKDFSFKYPNSNKILRYNGIIDIKPGEKILLSGVSGSGKSTLFYMLKGLIPNVILGKASGQILYNNKEINILSQNSKIGIVLQNPYNQFIHKTVLEELAFGLENLQYQKVDIIKKILYYTKKLNVEYLVNKKISQLSGGEAQKIAILSIIITEPEVLLLDEPTAFLDKQSIIEFLNLISQLDFNPSIIIIEHNYKYLDNIIDKTILINTNGDLQEMKKTPLSYRYNSIKNFATNNIILKIKNLSFQYEDRFILNNFNLELHKQEIIGIRGRCGIGKTTLLKIIAGIIHNYRGDIIIDNKNLKNYKNYQLYKILALLLQNPEKNFIYNKVIEEIGSINDLNQFNLSNLENHSPFNLSEGQKRILSILALNQYIKNRKIYLLDEPTFGQDYNNINILINFISKLNQDGSSFIVVSHDDNFLDSITNKIVDLI